MRDEKKLDRQYPFRGYAPGNYMKFCFNCRQKFIGDKRAVRCEPCAEYMDAEIQKLDAREVPHEGLTTMTDDPEGTNAQLLANALARAEIAETALAAEKRVKEEAQAACAFFADEGMYSDSYGVPGSDFGVCRFCEAGGAPGVPFEHNKSCPILRCEEVSAEWWTEREEERKDLTSAESRSAALARALEEAKEALRPFSEAASKAQISGCPPFQFCDARDYARARALVLAILMAKGREAP